MMGLFLVWWTYFVLGLAFGLSLLFCALCAISCAAILFYLFLFVLWEEESLLRVSLLLFSPATRIRACVLTLFLCIFAFVCVVWRCLPCRYRCFWRAAWRSLWFVCGLFTAARVVHHRRAYGCWHGDAGLRFDARAVADGAWVGRSQPLPLPLRHADTCTVDTVRLAWCHTTEQRLRCRFCSHGVLPPSLRSIAVPFETEAFPSFTV